MKSSEGTIQQTVDMSIPIWVMPDGSRVESEAPPTGFIGLVPNGAAIKRGHFAALFDMLQDQEGTYPIDF